MLFICITTMTSKWWPGSNIYPVLEVKFGWNTEEVREYNLALLIIVSLASSVFGLLVGTFLMKDGRRRAVIIGLSGIIVGSLCKVLAIFPLFLIGVFL